MSWFSRIGEWHSQWFGPDLEGANRNPPEPDQDPQQFDGHLDRNYFQQGLAPDHPPEDTPYFDPHTGVVWEADDNRSEAIWHGGNDCYRGTLPDETVDQLRADPHYRDAFDQVSGEHGYDVDTVTPGPQVCFDDLGALVGSGPYQGTWDYASPQVPGQSAEHWHIDVAPDMYSDDYTPYDQSSHFAGDGNSYGDMSGSSDPGGHDTNIGYD